MCGYAGSEARVPRRDMEPATWRALLPVLREAEQVGLHGAGEPLLYPHLFALLEALRGGRCSAGFDSNGHLLTTPVARRLVELGLGWVSVSIDAATPETYCRIRRRADLDALLERLRLGRVPEDPVEEIWNGRGIRLVREEMFSAAAPSCCHGCFVTYGR